MANMQMMIDGAKQVSAKYDAMKESIDVIRGEVIKLNQKLIVIEDKLDRIGEAVRIDMFNKIDTGGTI